MFKKIFGFVSRHKIITAIIIILAIIGGYYGYKTFFGAKTTTSYITATVQKGTLVVSVSGSGQISALDQIDVKAKTSGDAVYVGVKAGQEVKAGALLVQIDTRDAQKAVRDAEIALASAQLELEKMKSGEVLEVIADDPGFEKDFPAWCEISGEEFLGIEKEDNLIKGYVRKK